MISLIRHNPERRVQHQSVQFPLPLVRGPSSISFTKPLNTQPAKKQKGCGRVEHCRLPWIISVGFTRPCSSSSSPSVRVALLRFACGLRLTSFV
jgi:hypothetical protein